MLKIMLKLCGKFYNLKTRGFCNLYRKTIFNKRFYKFVAKDLNMKIKWKGKGINEKAFDIKVIV